MDDRRTFMGAIGAAMLASALPVRAQRSPARVTWISATGQMHETVFLDALRDGLRGLGYEDGRNLQLKAYWGDDNPARVEAQVAEVISSRPDVIVTMGPVGQQLAKLTSSIPIVFGYSGDPVLAGMVKSFARPGGNLSGISFLALDLVGKRLELLKAVMPGLKRIAVVSNSQHPGDEAERRASSAASSALGLELEYIEWRGAGQLDDNLSAILKARIEAVLMFPLQAIIANAARIAAWSQKNRVPVMSGWSRFADEGNLLTYGANLAECFRRLAVYADRVLKGARPADLPVELPQRIELVVNLKAARGLRINVPQSVLLRADRVIE